MSLTPGVNDASALGGNPGLTCKEWAGRCPGRIRPEAGGKETVVGRCPYEKSTIVCKRLSSTAQSILFGLAAAFFEWRCSVDWQTILTICRHNFLRGRDDAKLWRHDGGRLRNGRLFRHGLVSAPRESATIAQQFRVGWDGRATSRFVQLEER